MLKGLKRTFSRRAAAGKVDRSHHSTTSSDGTSSLFPLDDSAAPGQHTRAQRAADATIIARGARVPLDDDSVRARQALAAQRLEARGALDPGSAAYQVSVLLSHSTFFEHKLQSDAARALAAIRRPSSSSPAAGPSAALDCAPAESSPPAEPPPAEPSPSSSESSSSGPCARGGDVARVALALTARGYTVIVRRVVHSKAYWTKSFDNAFIVALDTSSQMGVEYIVDPHFRELFATGAMSGRYSTLWESLPPVFVGMPCQLQPVVQLLCEEVEASFLEAGRPCPPWRGWAATINRWMSDQFVDIPVPPPGAGQGEVALFLARCTAGGGAVVAAGAGAAGGAAGTPFAGSCGGGAAAAVAAPAAPGGAPGAPRGGALASSRGASDGGNSYASSCGGGAKRIVQQPMRAQVGFQAPASAPAAAPLRAAPPPPGPPAQRSSSCGGAPPAAAAPAVVLSRGLDSGPAAAFRAAARAAAAAAAAAPPRLARASDCSGASGGSKSGSASGGGLAVVYASGSEASLGRSRSGALDASDTSTLFDEDEGDDEDDVANLEDLGDLGGDLRAAPDRQVRGGGAAAAACAAARPHAAAAAGSAGGGGSSGGGSRRGLLSAHLDAARARHAQLFGLHAPAPARALARPAE